MEDTPRSLRQMGKNIIDKIIDIIILLFFIDIN